MLTESEVKRAYRGRRVLVTGHTGFKGAWLVHWLTNAGAEVTGYALAPQGRTLFEDAGLARSVRHVVGDIRDLARFRKVVRQAKPQTVFHLAAQALVRKSYQEPLETFLVNAGGTAAVLEALRVERAECTCVVVSSDKCYENREWVWAYRETDPMGGHDPYSMSKGATELVTASWRQSFFSDGPVRLASGRAGNVIGGGDWSEDRLVPDIVRALGKGEPVRLRNPSAVRPWQHVLEALSGYLTLELKLRSRAWQPFATGWNFGPEASSSRTVRDVVEATLRHFPGQRWVDESKGQRPHEAQLLKLSIDKARAELGWAPRLSFDQTVELTTGLYRHLLDRSKPAQVQAQLDQQLSRFLSVR